MKKFVAIFVACHLLVLSSLASAHMAVDAYDPHESVHAHVGVDHDDEGSAEHDTDTHIHLCVLALESSGPKNIPHHPSTLSDAFRQHFVSHAVSPPVPPPNA